MSKLVSVLCLLGVFSVVGCSSDSDDGGTATPEAACKSLVGELCSKFYGCFSDEELATLRSLDLFPVGNNEADCRTAMEQEQCTTENVKCDSGETYSSAKASECLDQYKSYSCDEFKSNSDGPAACNAICM